MKIKFDDDWNHGVGGMKSLGITGVNLLPDDVFYTRIENKLNYGHNVDSKSIQVEIDRIISLNGGNIPDKIITLLDSFR